jgi:hypothetical protein
LLKLAESRTIPAVRSMTRESMNKHLTLAMTARDTATSEQAEKFHSKAAQPTPPTNQF